MKTAGIAYLLGLFGVALDGRAWSVVLFLSCAATAAAVRHRWGGAGRWRNGVSHGNGYSGG